MDQEQPYTAIARPVENIEMTRNEASEVFGLAMDQPMPQIVAPNVQDMQNYHA